MKMYFLEPEVAGGFGSKSVIEHQNGLIKNIKYLEYVFDGWLGDELLASSPSFVITDALAKLLCEKQLTGFNIDKNIEVSTSEIFKELYPDRRLPDFSRFLVNGFIETDGKKITKWSGHDFCLRKGVYLYTTENAFNALTKNDRIKHFRYELIDFDA